MDVREVITERRNFGRYQWLQFLWLSIANILNGIHLVASVFIAASPSYRYGIMYRIVTSVTCCRDEIIRDLTLCYVVTMFP